jgi:[ribosomal protein S18]-alanine N-acetyltransferase
MIKKSFRIRRASRDDLDALVALEHAVFSGDRMSRRQHARHLRSASALVLVAERSRQLLAHALVFFRRDTLIARLYSIAVATPARGMGLGPALLASAERFARSRGCTRMRLEVRQDNPAAINLYERHGYRRFGAHQGYYEDGVHAWRYEKDL